MPIVSPAPQQAGKDAMRRGRGRWVVVAIIGALLVGAGVGAYLLLVKKDESASKVARGTAPSLRTTGATPTPKDPRLAVEDDAGTQTTQTASGASSSPETQQAAADVIRRHFELINEGDYAAAFALFSSDYAPSEKARAVWIASHERDAASIIVERSKFDRMLGKRRALVQASVIARNADRSGCERYAGSVQVLREAGKWRYEAGPRPDATWTRTDKLRKSDPDCRGLR